MIVGTVIIPGKLVFCLIRHIVQGTVFSCIAFPDVPEFPVRQFLRQFKAFAPHGIGDLEFQNKIIMAFHHGNSDPVVSRIQVAIARCPLQLSVMVAVSQHLVRFPLCVRDLPWKGLPATFGQLLDGAGPIVIKDDGAFRAVCAGIGA